MSQSDDFAEYSFGISNSELFGEEDGPYTGPDMNLKSPGDIQAELDEQRDRRG